MNIELTVVIPSFNEQYNIQPVVEAVILELSKINCLSYQIILVDDGSTDMTWSAITSITGMGNKNIVGLRFSRNFGKEAAIAAGLSYSKGNATIIMDADLQHPPSLISEMLLEWRSGNYQIVSAKKIKRQTESPLSKIASKFFYKVFNSLTGMELSNESDFKLLDRQVVDAWQKLGESQLFFRAIIPWLGFSTKTILFVPNRRLFGDTKWGKTKLLKLGISAVAMFSAKPLKIIWGFSILFFLITLIIGTKVIMLFADGEGVPGFYTVYFLQLISGSLILFSLALIATYLSKIFEEIKNRPRFIISESINSN
jgi:glycosyltransferase involved in cell wall biosynthesis